MFSDKLKGHLLMLTLYCVSHFFLISTWELQELALIYSDEMQSSQSIDQSNATSNKQNLD